MIWSRADVLEIRCIINIMCLNYPKTVSAFSIAPPLTPPVPIPACGEIVVHKPAPGAKKVVDPCPNIFLNGPFNNILWNIVLFCCVSVLFWLGRIHCLMYVVKVLEIVEYPQFSFNLCEFRTKCGGKWRNTYTFIVSQTGEKSRDDALEAIKGNLDGFSRDAKMHPTPASHPKKPGSFSFNFLLMEDDWTGVFVCGEWVLNSSFKLSTDLDVLKFIVD